MHPETDYYTSQLTSPEPPASKASAGQIAHLELVVPPNPLIDTVVFQPTGSDDLDFDFDSTDTSPRPPLSWASAAADALEGIHYVRERFPNDNVPFLPRPFRLEPLTVEPDDRVLLLDEVSEHAIRVRLLRTNQVGIVPAWNVEGPLEQLARRNMELNEIVTSPLDEEPVSHVLSRRYSGSTDGGLEDAEFPLTPTTPALAFLPSIRSPPASASASGISKSRKVGFSSPSKKTIFRYFPPHEPLESAWPDSDSEAGSDEPASAETAAPRHEDDAEEDSKWWWDGWEESHECDEEDAADEKEGSDDDAADRAAEEDARWIVEIGREFEETHTRSLSGRVFVLA